MKILIHGMQSSGASLFTFFLSQIENTIGVIDLFSPHLCPPLKSDNKHFIVIKTTVAKNIVNPNKIPDQKTVKRLINIGIKSRSLILNKNPLSAHIESFRPDKKILFLRNPYENYLSLRTKKYGLPHEIAGTIDEKFCLLELRFRQREIFDLTLYYEDFLLRPEQFLQQLNEARIPADQTCYNFQKNIKKIIQFNNRNNEWCRKFFKYRWGKGNIRNNRIDLNLIKKKSHPSLLIKNKINHLCPSICQHYSERNN